MADFESASGRQDEMQALERLILDTIRQYSDDTVYFKDRESGFLWNTQEHARQVGAASPEEMYGKTDFDFFPEEFAREARATELEIINTGNPVINQPETLIKEDGSVTYFLASKYPLFDKSGEIIGTWGISKDVTSQKKMEKELERSYQKMQMIARADDLTGLYNRRYFYESVERMIGIYDSRNDEGTFALIAIDADDLKFINDQYGQPTGDDVLRHIANAMNVCARKTDSCFRLGGDEFMMMLPECDKMVALGIAKKIMETVSSSPVEVGDGRKEKVTVSLGIAVYEKNTDIAELISLADRKLYKSKRNGKNQISF